MFELVVNWLVWLVAVWWSWLLRCCCCGAVLFVRSVSGRGQQTKKPTVILLLAGVEVHQKRELGEEGIIFFYKYKGYGDNN